MFTLVVFGSSGFVFLSPGASLEHRKRLQFYPYTFHRLQLHIATPIVYTIVKYSFIACGALIFVPLHMHCIFQGQFVSLITNLNVLSLRIF